MRRDAVRELQPLRGPWRVLGIAWVVTATLLYLAVRELGFFLIR